MFIQLGKMGIKTHRKWGKGINMQITEKKITKVYKFMKRHSSGPIFRGMQLRNAERRIDSFINNLLEYEL